MPVFKTAPTVSAFTEEWARRFEAAVRKASGKDGRISVTEARRLAEATSSDGLFSDTAVKVLDSFSQKTMSVNKLIDIARLEVELAVRDAAGPDGRLSLKDATRLPADIQDDFAWLRVSGVEPKQYTEAELKAAVTAEVLRALNDGTAKKLSAPPASVRGRRPVVESIPHPATNTRAIAYVANDTIYISRAASTPTSLVGWYEVGPLPPP